MAKSHVFQQLIVATAFACLPTPADAHRDANKPGVNRERDAVIQHVYLDTLVIGHDHSDEFNVGNRDFVNYCLRIDVEHDGHPDANTSTLLCGSIKAVEHGDEVPILLIGTERGFQGLMGGPVLLVTHKGECRPLNTWKVSAQLFLLATNNFSGVMRTISGRHLDGAPKSVSDRLPRITANSALVFKGDDAKFIRENFGAGLAATRISGTPRNTQAFGELRAVFERGKRENWWAREENDDYTIEIQSNVDSYGKCMEARLPPMPDTRRIGDQEGRTCFKSSGNPLCSDYGDLLRRQLRGLSRAAGRLRQSSGDDPGVEARIEDEAVERGLVALISALAHASATHQITVAEAAGNVCCLGLLELMRTRMREGDLARENAIEAGSIDALEEALASYEFVTTTLAYYNYGEKFTTRWEDELNRNFTESASLIRDVAWKSRGEEPEIVKTLSHELLARFDTLTRADQQRIQRSLNERFGIELGSLEGEMTSERRAARLQALSEALSGR